jgi:hypothetical protein
VSEDSVEPEQVAEAGVVKVVGAVKAVYSVEAGKVVEGVVARQPFRSIRA